MAGDPAFLRGPAFLTLLDFGGVPNNYEACVELTWLSTPQRPVQYYCGGVTDPRAGFRDPTHVLTRAFVELAYVRQLPSGATVIVQRVHLYNREPQRPPFTP